MLCQAAGATQGRRPAPTAAGTATAPLQDNRQSGSSPVNVTKQPGATCRRLPRRKPQTTAASTLWIDASVSSPPALSGRIVGTSSLRTISGNVGTSMRRSSQVCANSRRPSASARGAQLSPVLVRPRKNNLAARPKPAWRTSKARSCTTSNKTKQMSAACSVGGGGGSRAKRSAAPTSSKELRSSQRIRRNSARSNGRPWVAAICFFVAPPDGLPRD
mmetsp:Transcript_44750/g.130288  ORF Transcript_44750/g.130288 Transcript_44750/m.130288 type:complete len:217 (-) Transcript_44750:1588-2238(-)